MRSFGSAVLLLALLALPASAQQREVLRELPAWDAAPVGWSVLLREGVPDGLRTYPVRLRAEQENRLDGAECAGVVGAAPDLVLRYEAGLGALTVSATGDADLTLAVRTPDGTYACADDTPGSLDPALTLDAPTSGEYRIWVGVYDRADAGGRGTIGLSESGRLASSDRSAGGAARPPVVDRPDPVAPPPTGSPLPPAPPPPPPPPPEPEPPGATDGFFDDEAEAVVARYPAIEAPQSVDPGQAFTVLVSLAELRDAATAVVQGDTTAGGALVLPMPSAGGDRYTVVLHAAGFAVADDEQPLVLSPDGGSTPARFRLTADPDTPPGTRREIHATLWAEDGTYRGRFRRALRVGDVPISRTDRPTPSVLGADTPDPPPRVERPVPPDLTVEMIYGLDADRPRRARVTVRAGVQRFGSVWWDEPEGAQAYVEAQLGRLAALGARGTDEEAPDPDRAAATAEGIGLELWDRYAPPSVRDAFWALADRAAEVGVPFEAIQFVTNDAALPWELMRPTRAGETRGFLGAAFDVSRWHDGEPSPRRAPWAPQRVGVEAIAVVAPVYAGALALPATVQERLALGELAETRSVGGAFADVRSFLEAPPQAVLHFAGHGRVEGEEGAYSQSIVLEDGDLDLVQVRGLLQRAERAPPFVFFNACEVGQSEAAGGFVTGWGPTLLDAGAAGYVGPLWPVGDAAAAAFAESFYRSLLDHGFVARALREARRDLYETTGDVTALAYVYYGDPLQRVQIGR